MLGKGQEIPPSKTHTHTVIFLHGHGSNGSEFSEDFMCTEASNGQTLAEYFSFKKWMFPSAPTSCIPDSEHAEGMLQWFNLPYVVPFLPCKLRRDSILMSSQSDTEHPDSSEQEEVEHIAAAARDIADLVEREIAIAGADRVILGGTSQGCAIATYALLLVGRQLGGYIGLSSWLSSRHTLVTMLDENEALSTPVLLAHCQDDEMICIVCGHQLRDELRWYGMNVAWREYEDGGHWINQAKGERDIVDFISSTIT